MKKLLTVFISLLFILNISAGCNGPSSASLSAYFIDVGQADSILIDLGETEVLIDGGEKKDIAANYINDYVADGVLEAIIATHYDIDHIGGLSSVFNKYNVKEFWYNGKEPATNASEELMNLVNEKGIDTHIAKRGDTIKVGDLIFLVHNPGSPLSSDSNHDSIVLELHFGETEFLFMGDADQAAEREMLDELHDIDILKVGHHGSKYSSSPEFLNIVKPEIAIIVVGEYHIHNHPSEETINALNDIHANIQDNR